MKSKFMMLLASSMFLLTCNVTHAQDKSPIKFGKISSEDFDLSKHHFDTSVSAVIIADVGIPISKEIPKVGLPFSINVKNE